MAKSIHNRFGRGCRIFLAAWSLFVLAPFTVYGQDSTCKPLKEKILILEKMIEELGDANSILLENLVACTEENRDLEENLRNARENPGSVKQKEELHETQKNKNSTERSMSLRQWSQV